MVHLGVKKKNRINWLGIAKRLFIIVVTLIVLFGVIIIGLRIHYRDFYNTAQREFLVPGLSDNLVPQGFTYYEKEDVFVISGYIAGNEKGRVIVVKPDGNYRMLTILDEDGSELICHMGGISIFEEYVYIAGCDGTCYVLSSEVLFYGDSEKINVIGSFQTGNDATFCFVSGDFLYVGEYHHIIKYKTKKSHHMISPNGDKNKAIVLRFELGHQYPLGVNTSSDMALSITARIQGACLMGDGIMVLSASSIFQGSQLYYYDYKTIASESADIYEVEGRAIPLYYLDNDNLKETVSILPKSEGITVYNNSIFVVFESASTRFQYGKLLDAQYVYSLPLKE